jgi:pimeloyl-ACP methyl ester carboxylesterase
MTKYYTEKYFLTKDGAKINYVDVGQGNPETIVMMHGWMSYGRQFAPLGQKLMKTHRVVWMDHRGHGKTFSNGPYTIQQLAADVKALIEYLDLKNITLLGYSMGAATLFQYVRDYGCLYLKKAVIIDMSPKLLNDEEWRHGLYQGNYREENYRHDLEHAKANWHKFVGYVVRQTFFKHKPSDPRDYRPNILFTLISKLTTKDRFIEPYRQFFIELAKIDYRKDLPGITVPLGIFYTRPGSLYEEGAALYIQSQVPDGRLYPFDNATHVSPGFRAKETWEKLLDFEAKTK